jgi:hypothetical protein
VRSWPTEFRKSSRSLRLGFTCSSGRRACPSARGIGSTVPAEIPTTLSVDGASRQTRQVRPMAIGEWPVPANSTRDPRTLTDFDPDQSFEVVQINVHPKAARNLHRLPMLGADDVAFDAV